MIGRSARALTALSFLVVLAACGPGVPGHEATRDRAHNLAVLNSTDETVAVYVADPETPNDLMLIDKDDADEAFYWILPGKWYLVLVGSDSGPAVFGAIDIDAHRVFLAPFNGPSR